MDDDAIEALADRFFAAIEAGDLAAVEALYAPSAQIWHNTDGVTQDVTGNLRVLGWMATHVEGLAYTEVRRSRIDGGFVQQHVCTGTAPDGERFALPACLVVRVDDAGRISRLDEYLDSAHVAPLVRAAAAARGGRTG